MKENKTLSDLEIDELLLDTEEEPEARLQNNHSSKKRKVEPEPEIELINVPEDDHP